MKTMMMAALAAITLVSVGCAGMSPAAIDRLGNVQPSVQVYQQPIGRTSAVEFANASVSLSPLYGFDNLQFEPFSFGFSAGETAKNTANQSFILPFKLNLDGSATLFRFGGLQFKFMPMAGRQ